MCNINFFLIGLILAFPKFFEAQATLRGTVAYLNSSSRPAVGVEVSAFGANSCLTNNAGMFELVFPTKRPGDKVKIILGNKDSNGNSLEIVNDKVLAQAHIPSRPDDDILDVIVCKIGQRNEAAQQYYGLFIKTANETYEKRLREIEQAVKTGSNALVSLEAEKDKLRTERDSAIAFAEEQALFVASINLDKASKLVRDAVEMLNKGQNIHNAIAILNNEKLFAAYQSASKTKIKADSEIIQVIEGFELKIRLLTPTFNHKEVVACCLKLEEIYKKENYDIREIKNCFDWVVLYPRKSDSNYYVDVAASNIVWTGYKVTGKHTGTVKIKKGSLTWVDGKLTNGSFEIDMNSITDTDLEGEYAGKLVGHLKSDDFFGVAKYPTSKFVITRAIPQDTKGNYKIIGNMTIKGTTKEIKFFAAVSETNGIINASGKITLDRSEFDVRFGSGSFFDGLGDKTIYDEFDLQVLLIAKR